MIPIILKLSALLSGEYQSGCLNKDLIRSDYDKHGTKRAGNHINEYNYPNRVKFTDYSGNVGYNITFEVEVVKFTN